MENDELLALLNNPPQTIEGLISAITPGLYSKLRNGIELGKWEDGQRLDKSQIEQCLQLVIMYEAQNLPEHERTGAPLAKKSNCETIAAVPGLSGVESEPIRVIQGDMGETPGKN